MMLKSSVVKRLEMKMFSREANELCLAAPVSRGNFIQYWESQGFQDSTMMSDSEDSFANNSDSAIGSPASADLDEPVQMSSANSYEHTMFMEYQIGTVDVHIENLVPPHQSRLTRLLDHEHVRTLMESFSSTNCGQIVILQGMLTNQTVPVRSLCEEGACDVEVLGGNHTREALQSLLRKGMLECTTVRVNLFKPLPRMLALRIGYQHNSVLHEKKKPVTFIDKVRLIRECRPSQTVTMSSKQIAEWKESLLTVFGVKDRRKLQQTYGLHLSMAVLLPDLWTKVSLAAEKFKVTEKFFRGLSRLLQDEDKEICLNVLLSEGMLAYKEKVKEYIDAGMVKSNKSKKKRKASEMVLKDLEDGDSADGIEKIQENETQTEEIEDKLEDLSSSWEDKYRHLMEKYEELKKENSILKIKIGELEEKEKEQTLADSNIMVHNEIEMVGKDMEHKRRRCLKNVFSKGEIVMAFWRDEATGEESWQKAKVLFPYTDGRCRVEWKSDGMISTTRAHEVQKLGSD